VTQTEPDTELPKGNTVIAAFRELFQDRPQHLLDVHFLTGERTPAPPGRFGRFALRHEYDVA
jgi:hypothetical protein